MPNTAKKKKAAVGVTQKVKKKRFVKCNNCEACKSPECGECIYCKDKPRYGGPNLKRQACSRQRCLVSFKLSTCMHIFLKLRSSGFCHV